MAYKTSELEKQTLKLIEENKYLFTIQDVVSKLPCCSATFYNHKLEDLETIKKALDQNKINLKLKIRKRWDESDNPTTDITLYKLIATEDELDRLTSQKATVEHKGKIIIDFTTID